MPWTPLPRIAFAIATHPFNPTTRDDLPLELGDELYIIESCANSQWYRGYLVAPPSLLAGLTTSKGATLEARVFSGIFPAACVDVKEYLSTEVPLAPEDAADANEGDEVDADDSRSLKRSRSRRKRNSLMRTPSMRDRERGQEVDVMDRPRPAAPVPMLKVGDETSSYESEPLVDEIASCLREWHAANLHELLLGRQYPLLDEISGLVQQLDLSRRQLLYGVLTKAELARTREETVWRLVKGNKLLSREIIVRDPVSGRILTGEDSSVEITKLQGTMSLLEEPPRLHAADGSRTSHLFMEHKAFVGATSEQMTVVYYLATKNNQPVSESFTVDLDAKGRPLNQTQSGTAKLQALFTDISARDTEDLYLVARVYTTSIVFAGPSAPELARVDSSGSDGGGSFGGTLKGMKKAVAPPVLSSSSKEHNKRGRVSVLWSPRPKTAGREDQENRQPSRNGVKSSGGEENRPPSESAPSIPVLPLQQKKIMVKKALGVGALSVSTLISQDKGVDEVMRIFVPTTQHHSSSGSGTFDKVHLHKHTQETREDWDRIIKDVIEARTNKSSVPEPLRGTNYRPSTGTDMRLPSEKSQKADRLHIYLRSFSAEDAEELVRSMPTVLHQSIPVHKLGFSGAPKKPRSDIYITLSVPNIAKHALLLHPKLGSSAVPPASQFSSLQVALEVRKETGTPIKDCIFPSANAPGQTVWTSCVVDRFESWGQTIKLALDEEDVPTSHVFMTISGVPNAPAAMAWFPLWDQGAFLKDGEHELVMQKYDEYTATPDGNPALPESGYFKQPWTAIDEGWSGALTMSGAAAGIKIRSYLCSTKFSQDDVLLKLLGWKELEYVDLVDMLKKVIFVPEMEIVKLLREVFDALFKIVVEHASKNEIEDLVFHAIITVLGIVYDRRFNLEPIVDEYAEKHFDYPFATPCLLRSFTRLLQDPSHVESSVRLRAAFKVGKHIFRFIVHAREKQVVKEANIGINASQTFVKDLHGVFKLLETLMSNSDARLVGSQTLAVQHFHTWLPELTGVLTREEILLLAIDFMDACEHVKGKLVLYKLVLIVNYSRSSLFSQPEDRRALTLNTVRWLDPHWGKTDDVTAQWRDQVRLCCSVLAEQVEELGEEVSDYIPKIIHSYRAIQSTGRHERESFSLLFPKTYPFPSKHIAGRPVFDEALIELAAILAALSNIPTGLHLDLPEDELAAFLMDELKVHMSILSCEAFPDSWLSVHIYQHKSAIRTLETLAGILVDSFLPDPDDAERFNTDLWLSFFETLLMLVGSDALALETFPEQKRRAVWKVAGDVREQGADLLRRTWEAIGWETAGEDKARFGIEKMGGYQVQYVPGLVAPIVELCLSVHEGLRSVAVEVLQTMVVSEWTLSQDLSVIQAEMIDSLDRLFKSKRLTESITQKLFIADLIELFRPLSLTPEDPLSETVANLLRTVDVFLDLLVAVHNTPLGEAYQIMDTLKLMEFLKDMRKEDMFIRYVHQLVNVQLRSNNLIEAGLSLKLHADLYTWDITERVPALSDPSFPEQTAFERRESLCLEMIKYFEDGQSWENALDTYRELADNYEHVSFEYGKLARCHRAMAKLQEQILSTDRLEMRYYRVAYYGMGFPVGLRDRAFIIQAGPWEDQREFTDRMLQLHPTAQVVDGIADSVEGQFLQVTPVHPEMDYSHPVWRKTRVPDKIREYVARHNVRTFYVPTPREPGLPLWSEKTIFIAAEGFPAVLKRSEVVHSAVVAVSPVETAIEDVLARTKELIGLEKKFTDIKATSENRPDLGPLSVALTNAVDAHRSVANLREFLAEPETKLELREALRTVMADHTVVIRRALATHGRLLNDGMKGVQDTLVRCFEQTFLPELAEAPSSAAVSPGQWRARVPSPSSRDGEITPVPMQTAISVNITNGTGGLNAPPRHHSPAVSGRDTPDSASVVRTGTMKRGRLTSMIFGHSYSGSNVSNSTARGDTQSTSNGQNGHASKPSTSSEKTISNFAANFSSSFTFTAPPFPPPPAPGSTAATSRRSSVDTSYTSKSAKSSKSAPGPRSRSGSKSKPRILGGSGLGGGKENASMVSFRVDSVEEEDGGYGGHLAVVERVSTANSQATSRTASSMHSASEGASGGGRNRSGSAGHVGAGLAGVNGASAGTGGGMLERGVGSVRKRWSKLGLAGLGRKVSARELTAGGAGGSFREGVVEEE